MKARLRRAGLLNTTLPAFQEGVGVGLQPFLPPLPTCTPPKKGGQLQVTVTKENKKTPISPSEHGTMEVTCPLGPLHKLLPSCS